MGLHEVVVLGRSLMGKFGEEGESRPPPDAELWEKNVGALAEAFEAVRPCVPHLESKHTPRHASVGSVSGSCRRQCVFAPAADCTGMLPSMALLKSMAP